MWIIFRVIYNKQIKLGNIYKFYFKIQYYHYGNENLNLQLKF